MSRDIDKYFITGYIAFESKSNSEKSNLKKGIKNMEMVKNLLVVVVGCALAIIIVQKVMKKKE